MSTDKDGGPAFPGSRLWDDKRGEWESTVEGGMSLRAYFAAKAMQSIIAAVYVNADARSIAKAMEKAGKSDPIDWVSWRAVNHADSLLAELEARKP